MAERARAKINARELDLLNQAADKLNAEVADTLDYQASWE
jgi:hypothetical protein